MPVEHGVNIAVHTIDILRVGQNKKTVLVRSGIPDTFSSLLTPYCCGHVSFEALGSWPLHSGNRKEFRSGLVALLVRLWMRRADRNSHPLGNCNLGDFINTELFAESRHRIHIASTSRLQGGMQIRRGQDQYRPFKILSHLVRQRRRRLGPGLLRLLRRRGIWLVLHRDGPLRVEVLTTCHLTGLPQCQLTVAASMLQPLEVGLLGLRVIAGCLNHICVLGIAINVTLQQIFKWPHCAFESASIQPIAIAACSGCKDTGLSRLTAEQSDFPKKIARSILMDHDLTLLPTDGGRCCPLLHNKHFIIALSLINDSFAIRERLDFEHSGDLGNLVAAQRVEKFTFLQEVAAALKILHANIHNQSLKAVAIQTKDLGIVLRNDGGCSWSLVQHGQLPE
mmetsp:Transcript_20718/g.46154  ORF Transcript_20718/g.46154 Transcript_20718/m.46154 type:complete len:394 (-) Transcript_20718:774-1955(-)